MKFPQLATMIILSGFVFACGNTTTHEHAEAETTGITAEHADEPATTTEVKLTLNNGAKWIADESTFTGMKRLELTIYNFKQDNPDPAIEDYHKLGEALANIDADIISQCSMQGEDHDQLHILLAPMLQNVDVIKNGNDIEAAHKNLLALEKAVARFFTHFEVK